MPEFASPSGARIAEAALSWVGTPFHWEAALKGHGCDCRGLLTGVAAELDRPEAGEIEARLVGYSRRIDETALLAGLDRLFRRVEAPVAAYLDAVQPGDVLAFRIGRPPKVQHLGIMGFGGRFVHAYSRDPERVLTTPLPGLWARRLAGVWRWKDI